MNSNIPGLTHPCDGTQVCVGVGDIVGVGDVAGVGLGLGAVSGDVSGPVRIRFDSEKVKDDEGAAFAGEIMISLSEKNSSTIWLTDN